MLYKQQHFANIFIISLYIFIYLHIIFVSVLRDEFRLEPQSTRIAAGEDVILECGPPKGTPEPQVTWRKDGHTLEIEGRLKLVDGSSLAITDARSSDDGRYQCVARNTVGVRESTVALLKVHGNNSSSNLW